MDNFKSIHDYYGDLGSNYEKLSDYEKLSIAVQMQRNDILRAGLVVSQGDKHASALESIAMQLGMGLDGKTNKSDLRLLAEATDFLAECVKNK